MARMSPVSGFMTTTLPEAALWLSTAAAISRSATNWRRSSMVSVSEVPGLAGMVVCGAMPRR